MGEQAVSAARGATGPGPGGIEAREGGGGLSCRDRRSGDISPGVGKARLT